MQTGLDVSQPSPSEWAPSQSAGRQRMSWVLRQYPFSQHAGRASWIRSLLDTCRRAGWSIDLLVPAASLLPLVVGQSAQLRVHAPGLRAVTVHRSVTTGRGGRPAGGLGGVRPRPPARSAPPRLRAPAPTGRPGGRSRAGPSLDDARTAVDRRHVGRPQPTVVVFDSLFALAPTANGVRRLALAHDVISERAASLARSGYRTTPKFVKTAPGRLSRSATWTPSWPFSGRTRRRCAAWLPSLTSSWRPRRSTPRPGYGHRIEMPAGEDRDACRQNLPLCRKRRATQRRRSFVVSGARLASRARSLPQRPVPRGGRLPVRSPAGTGCHAGRRSR